jgi:hypothetical protein
MDNCEQHDYDYTKRLFSEGLDSKIDQDSSSFMRNSGTTTSQFRMVQRHMSRIQKHIEKQRKYYGDRFIALDSDFIDFN